MFSKGFLVLLLGLVVISPALGRIAAWRLVAPGTISNAVEEVAENSGDSSDESADEVRADPEDDSDSAGDEETNVEVNDEENEIVPEKQYRLAFACRFNVMMYDPTCASDGNTYANRRELGCAQKKDSSITEVECDPSNPYRRRVFTLLSDE